MNFPPGDLVTDGMIAFINARLGEIERFAVDALEYGDATTWRYSAGSGEAMTGAIAVGLHHSHHSPARVLREVAAKRAILAAHMPGEFKPHRKVEILCRTCVTEHDDYMDLDNPDPWPCATIRALAAVDSDHPDYREEWKP